MAQTSRNSGLRDNPKCFFIAAFIICLLAAISVPLASIIIDPFYRFGLVSIKGFNAQKPQFAAQGRMAKAGEVCRLQPASVAMGTSRVEVGIDPSHPGWNHSAGPVYNLALAGSGLKELYLTLQHAVHASRSLRLVIIGLDFLMFNANREAVVFGTEVFGFDEKRLLLSKTDSCWQSFIYDADTLVGPAGLPFDVATVLKQMAKPDSPNNAQLEQWKALYHSNGFRGDRFDVLIPPAQHDRTTPESRSIFGAEQEYYYAKRIWRPPPSHRYCFTAEGQPDTLAEFRDIVAFARKSNIELRFFTNPIHIRMLVALQEIGLWPQYEDWKRGITEILAQDADTNHVEPFPLWDFSGANTVTTEEIPPLGHWWWEPSHYTRWVGDMMLDRILNYHDAARSIPEDFGILLTRHNIEQWIVTTRDGLLDYAAREPREISAVHDSLRPLMEEAEGSNCGYDVDAVIAGSAALQRGDRKLAEAEFARAAAIHEADKQRFAAIGVPFREKAFDSLLARARSGKEVTPPLDSWIAYQDRGNERLASGDLEGAADDFSRAIRLAPPNPALYFLRGSTRLRLAQFTQAAEDFEAGLKLDPGNAPLKQLLAQAEQAKAPPVARPDAVAAAELQHQADAARSHGDLPGAIKDYSEAIRLSPPNTALYYLRGTARLELGDQAGAAEDFEAGLKLDPENATLKQLLAQAQQVKTLPAALDAAAAAELQHQADAARSHGDLPGAIKDYSEAIRLSPPNTALYYLRGTARLELGDQAGAAVDFEAGLKLDPDNATLKQLLAQARQVKAPPVAVIDAAAAAELQRQADAARSHGDLAGAIKNYSEAIRLSPPNTALYYLRGTARLELGDQAGAAEDFEAGLKLDPGNATLKQLLEQAQTGSAKLAPTR